MQTYLVGGAVRDKLLGIPVKERDWVVVGATPQAMLAAGYQQVGKDFPVFLHPKTSEEYALARTERKVGKGYKGFTFNASNTVSLEDDLKRRDLTINAMAQTENGDIIDPYGGQRDLQQRVLRHVSPAFVEDPVRLLRAARFAARYKELGFSLAPETSELLREMVANGEINALVPERVWAEFVKALQSNSPEQFFLELRNCQALPVLFPEIAHLFEHTVPLSKKTFGDFTLHCLQIAVQKQFSETVRFAVLMHAIGMDSSHNTLDFTDVIRNNAQLLLKNFSQRYRIPSKFAELAHLVISLARFTTPIVNLLDATDIVTLFEKTDAFRRRERLQLSLQALEAITQGWNLDPHTSPSQTLHLLTLLDVALTVKAQPLLTQGLTGLALAKELRELRVQAVQLHINIPK